MTKISPEQRCQHGGGVLAPPELLPFYDKLPKPLREIDYVCVDCQTIYGWEGNPPELRPVS